MFAMLPCGVETKVKGIADACMECLRHPECLAEGQSERRKAGNFLAKIKDRLSANEARAAPKRRPTRRSKR